MWTKEKIVNLLETNDLAVGRALIVILKNQTDDEIATQSTNHSNGKGFNGAHGKIGTSMALQAMNRKGYLSEKQVAYWRKRDSKGNMRIALYWKQLQNEINSKVSE